jgi:hypothetical protein
MNGSSDLVFCLKSWLRTVFDTRRWPICFQFFFLAGNFRNNLVTILESKFIIWNQPNHNRSQKIGAYRPKTQFFPTIWTQDSIGIQCANDQGLLVSCEEQLHTGSFRNFPVFAEASRNGTHDSNHCVLGLAHWIPGMRQWANCMPTATLRIPNWNSVRSTGSHNSQNENRFLLNKEAKE